MQPHTERNAGTILLPLLAADPLTSLIVLPMSTRSHNLTCAVPVDHITRLHHKALH
jgi:hypothetical protein